MFSPKTYAMIAIMLDQIEKGAPWPKAAMNAKIIFLEKDGAPAGKVMSFRPLTITSPFYRCWATMRLIDMQPWVSTWALPVMHAGVPQLGAVDAWYDALSHMEELKIDEVEFSGGVADITTFFD